MKTTNSVLHTQLVEIFEQHPYLTSLSHDDKGIYFLQGDTALQVNYDQVETIAIQPDKIQFTLGNEVIYTVTLSTDRVQVTLPAIEE